MSQTNQTPVDLTFKRQGWSEPAIFSNLGRHTIEADIIMQRYEVHYWLLVTQKCLTFNDLEMPFCAKICFYGWFH